MLVFKFVNFAIIVGGLVWAIRKFDLFSFLGKKRKDIKSNIDKAEEDQKRARELLKDKKKELEKAQLKQKEIIREAKRIGNQTKQDITANAERETSRIIEEAEAMAEMEKERIKNEIKRETIRQVINTARDMLKTEVTENDHEAMIEGFLEQLGSSELSLRV